MQGIKAAAGTASDDEKGAEEIEEEEVKVKPPIKEAEDSDSLPENEKIKENLKNSSKVYYSVTHTIQEEIKE